VGGGPAGASAAAWLAEAGRRVVLLERTPGPHDKVCGEFLSAEAAGPLRSLGLDPAALGAEPIERARVAAGGARASAALPFPAFGVTRRALDEALLRAAAERGAEIRRGVAVRALEPLGLEPGSGAVARVSGGADVSADFALLATGKHDLRGRRRHAPGRGDPIGFKMHLALRPAQARALEGHVELHLFPGGYAGLQPSPGGLANLCLVVERGAHEALGRSWQHLLDRVAPPGSLLAERIAGAEPRWPRPLAVYGIPYGFVARGAEAGAIGRVGDQLAVIPSFTGDGMAIALHSARRAALAHLAGEPPPDGAAYRGQVGLARLFLGLLTGAAGAAVGLARIAPGVIPGVVRLTRSPR
jgi:flavin-dependent dehydrogenase